MPTRAGRVNFTCPNAGSRRRGAGLAMTGEMALRGSAASMTFPSWRERLLRTAGGVAGGEPSWGCAGDGR
jgi:hypothetical protein